MPEPPRTSERAIRDICRRANIGRPGVDVTFYVQQETFYRTGFCQVSVRLTGYELDITEEQTVDWLLEQCTDRKWKLARHAAKVAKMSTAKVATAVVQMTQVPRQFPVTTRRDFVPATPSRRDFDPDARHSILADPHISSADKKALRTYFRDEC